VNGDRFDDLARLLARHTTRRRILTTAVWSAVALLAGALRPGGIPAAAGSSTLAGQICSQQDQVSFVVQCCPSGATNKPGTCHSLPGSMRWTGGVSTSWSSDQVLTATNGQTHDNEWSRVAPPRYPARTGHVQPLSHRSHPPRSAQAGPHSTLVTPSSGPGNAWLIVRRGREAGVPMGLHDPLPRRTRGPPPSSRRG
jgi:hypothetical protein